jgi:hypothetical protein
MASKESFLMASFAGGLVLVGGWRLLEVAAAGSALSGTGTAVRVAESALALTAFAGLLVHARALARTALAVLAAVVVARTAAAVAVGVDGRAVGVLLCGLALGLGAFGWGLARDDGPAGDPSVEHHPDPDAGGGLQPQRRRAVVAGIGTTASGPDRRTPMLSSR